MVSHYLPSFARRGRRRCWVTWPQRRVTHPQKPPNAWPFQPSDRWVLPAQCPGWKTPSRSAVFLSASRRRGHFSSKMQPGRKGPAGSPSGPALCVPAASQRPCRHPCPGPHSSAHPGVGASTQRPHPPPSVKSKKKKPSEFVGHTKKKGQSDLASGHGLPTLGLDRSYAIPWG